MKDIPMLVTHIMDDPQRSQEINLFCDNKINPAVLKDKIRQEIDTNSDKPVILILTPKADAMLLMQLNQLMFVAKESNVSAVIIDPVSGNLIRNKNKPAGYTPECSLDDVLYTAYMATRACITNNIRPDLSLWEGAENCCIDYRHNTTGQECLPFHDAIKNRFTMAGGCI